MKRRNTATSQQILELLKSSNHALSHEMIQKELPTKDRATIYRVLNRFFDDGVVHKVIGDDGKQYFALCTQCETDSHSHDHIHFRCTECGTVECLHKKIEVTLPKGYVMENLNSLISGKCGACA